MSSDYLAKRVFAFGVGFMSFFRIRYHYPPASSVFLSKHHGRTGGYFEHFLAIKPIKKVPKEKGNTQQCRTRRVRIHIVFFFIIRSLFRFCLSRGYPVYDSHDFVYPTSSRPIEGLMSLSFWMGWLGKFGS